MTIVQAPAGYGKSLLLASWSRRLRQQGVAVAWPAPPDDPSDPNQFLAALIIAVADAVAADAPPADGIQTASPRFAARRLASMIGAAADPLVIIVDDYDRASGEALDAILGDLIRTLPAPVHWVLVSRTALGIPFGPLWYQANVTQFGQKDLRFSDTEIAAMFEHRLTPENLARISVWTEGWPVAVQLARHYLTHAEDARDLDQLLGQADGDVGRYLTEQVLQSLPERHRELLILSSFLDEFRVDLVEAVTGIRPAWLILQDLQNSNVLLAPVDEAEGWVRCHHLLREVMYGQLRRRGRGELGRLQLAAARWFQDNGQVREAIRHAAAAGDFDLAARLVLDAGGIFYGVRYGAPALRLLLRQLPPEIVSDYPRLSLAQIGVLAKEGRLDVAADILRAIKLRYRDLLSSAQRHADPLLVRDVAMAELMIAVYVGLHISPSAVGTLEAAARDAPPEAFWLHSIVYNLLCINRYRSSDFPGALGAAETALYYYGQARSSNGIGHMHLHVGLIALEMADPIAAIRHYQAGRTAFETGLCGDEAGCTIADVLIAEALCEQGRIAEARRLCAASLEAAESAECHYECLIAGYGALTRLITLDEGPQAAIRALGRGLAFARRRRFIELERYLNLRRRELQLDAGEYSALVTGAAGGASPLRGRPGTDIVPWRERDLQDRLEARIALNSGEPAAALAALEQKAEQAARAGRIRERVRLLVQFAVAAEASGARARALAGLRTAIRLGLPGGLVMPFVEQGQAAMALLAQLVTQSGPDSPGPAECDFVRRVLRIGAEFGAAPISVFSHREQEIVRLLVQGTNNKLMARALGISPETVRFHLKSIYEKFGVSDRKVVAVLARERGLLD